jgi:hypothetical protein
MKSLLLQKKSYCLGMADKSYLVRLKAPTRIDPCSSFSGPRWVLVRARLSNAPVFRLCLVVDLSYERSGIGTEAAGSGGGGEAGCGV